MAETTIEWTSYRRPDGSKVPGYTFNPWVGCSKVSAGCKNCYAEVETFARVQRAHGRELWGVNGDRHLTSDENWAKPLRWNALAVTAGERRRVFCASMADVFEDHPGIMPGWRARLGQLILATPHLDWLLLTKRPENVYRMLPDFWVNFSEPYGMPGNVWLGTSVENQEMADRRIPELLKVPARLRFLSVEPLLGPVDLSAYLPANAAINPDGSVFKWFGPHGFSGDCPTFYDGCNCPWVDWVIVGGESGRNARPMRREWVTFLRDQCQAAGTSFFFKQWGAFHPAWCDGTDPIGKKRAGRSLDGRTWDESPTQSPACSRHGYDDCPACNGGGLAIRKDGTIEEASYADPVQ